MPLPSGVGVRVPPCAPTQRSRQRAPTGVASAGPSQRATADDFATWQRTARGEALRQVAADPTTVSGCRSVSTPSAVLVIRPEPDQRISGAQPEGLHHHSGGLGDLDAFERSELLPAAAPLRRAVPVDIRGHQVQQRQRAQLRRQQAIGQRIRGHRTGLVAEQGERPDRRRDQGDRQREHDPHALPQDGVGVGRPTRCTRARQVRDQHRRTLRDGVQTRSLAKGELVFVELPAQCATGTERPIGGPVVAQGHSRAVHLEQLDAGVAEPVRHRKPSIRALEHRPEIGPPRLDRIHHASWYEVRHADDRASRRHSGHLVMIFSASNGASNRKASPRWLMASLSAAVSSAVVRLPPAGTKIGS